MVNTDVLFVVAMATVLFFPLPLDAQSAWEDPPQPDPVLENLLRAEHFLLVGFTFDYFVLYLKRSLDTKSFFHKTTAFVL